MFRYVLIFFLLFAVASGPAAYAEPLAKLREIRTSGGIEPKITVISEAPLTYTTYSMPTLLREVIDISNTDPGGVGGDIPVNSGMISKISVQKKLIGELPLTRVIVHLQREAEMRVVAGNEGNNSITASFRKSEQAATPAPTRGAAPPSTLPRSGAAITASNGKPVISRIEMTPTGFLVASSTPIDNFHAFRLSGPERLVVDIPNAASTVLSTPIPSNPWGIEFFRTGIYQEKLRLVFDRSAGTFPPFQATRTDEGLHISFAPNPPK